MFDSIKEKIGQAANMFRKPKEDVMSDIEVLHTIKYAIKSYSEETNQDYRRWEIHLIQAERKEGGVVVDVVAGKPGIMIGRAGKDIEALSGYVAKWMECPVKINIQEFDPMK